MSPSREKFATQARAELLADVRRLAEEEGRQFQSLVDEAFADLIDKHRNGRPRPHVLAAYLRSHELYAGLYKKLAE
jgi:hypothetical protein